VPAVAAAGEARPSSTGSGGALPVSEPSLQVPEMGNVKNMQSMCGVVSFQEGFTYRSKEDASKELTIHHSGHEVP
jgi:hypothetical protein